MTPVMREILASVTVTDARRGYAPLLLDMLPLYPSFIETEPPIRDGWRASNYLAHGWYLRCHRGVEALLLLDGNGFAEEASPLRRSIIEHVINLRWLAVEGDGVLPTIASGQAFSGQKRSYAAAVAKWASVDQAFAAQAVASAKAGAVNPANDYLLNFVSRVERYGDVHTIPGYLAERARTHPSYESAVCYVDIEPANRGLLLHQSRDAVGKPRLLPRICWRRCWQYVRFLTRGRGTTSWQA